MILYILDTNYFKKEQKVYLIISIICLIFSCIYELFSHGVYSIYMLGAFIIPLLLGALKAYFYIKTNKRVGSLKNDFYNAGIITLMVGFIMNGFLEIYGTTNKLIYVYLILGIFLILISMCKK